MSDRAVEVSVVLPAYNEATTIRDTVATTLETLASFLPAGSFELLIAEDGCTDRTPEIAAELAESDDRVRHVHSDDRLGRGGALEYAFGQSTGETFVYFDTDLATDMSHLPELVESVRSGEYDIATGSRRLAGNRAQRPIKRDIPSTGFNTLVRLLLGSRVYDHQCGFKAFDRAALETVLEDVEDTHWFWDTEVLVRAQRAGFRVKEFPVEWTAHGDTKVDLVRDVFGMGSATVRTWWQLSVQPRVTPRTSVGAGMVLVVVALALMTVYLDPREVLTEMASADPTLVALATVVYVFTWPLRGLRYRDILRKLGYQERVGFLTGAVFISQTGNLVFPARAGDAVRAYIVKARRQIPYPSGFASLAVERVFDLLTIAAIAGVVFIGLAATGATADLQSALFGTGPEGQQSGRVAVAVAAAVGVGAFVALGAIIASARAETNYVRGAVLRLSSDSYAEMVAGVIERFVGDIQTVANDRGAFVSVATTSVLIWTLDVLTAVLVLAAFGVDVPLITLLAVGFFAVSIGNLAKVLPLSPGGIGLYEGAFTVLVVALTPIAGPVALGAAIVDHAIKNIVTVIGGLISMVVLNVSLTTAVEESAEVQEAEATVGSR